MNGYAVPAPENDLDEMAWVLLSMIRVPRYQRHEPTELRITKMASTWTMKGASALVVSYRDGVLWIIDGQTRWRAARRLGLDRLRAVVLQGLTEPEEASIFLKVNRDRLRVSALDRHSCEAIAGEERALMIDLVLEQNGLVAATASQNGLVAIQPIVAVEWVWGEGGNELLDRVLQLLAKGLPNDSARFRGEMIDGLGYFLARDPWNAGDEKVLKMMLRTPVNKYDELRTHWKSIATNKGGKGGSPLYMAHAFATIVYGNAKGLEWKPKRV